MDLKPETDQNMFFNNPEYSLDIEFEPLKDEYIPKDETANDSVDNFECNTEVEIKTDTDDFLVFSVSSDVEENAIDNALSVSMIDTNEKDLHSNNQESTWNDEVSNDETSERHLADSRLKMEVLVKKHIAEHKRVEIVKIVKLADWRQYFVCDTCFKMFITRYLLTKHAQSHRKLAHQITKDNKSRIVCGTCEVNCPNVNERKTYVNSDNEEEAYTCVPPAVVAAVENGGVCFKCNFCEYVCRFKFAYKKHVLNHFSTELFQCKDCTFECDNDGDMQNHRNVSHGVVSCVKLSCCDLCKLKFITKDELDTHRVSDHNVRLFKCKDCSLKFDKRTELIKHKLLLHNLNNRDDLFVCDLCKVKFAYKKDLHVHKVTFHNLIKPYKCEVCSYQCKQEKRMRSHTKQHCIEQEYRCENCSFNCKFEIELIRHSSERHGTERIYSCGSCNYKAKTKARLRQHVTVHSAFMGFHCDKCDYKCKLEANLRKHKITHVDDRPYKCILCPSAFRNKYGLTKHVMKHAREPPLQCTLCPFESTAVGGYSMKRHMLNMHGIGANKDLIFSCVLCQYKCRLLCVLKNHILKHTGEKPLACDLCSFRTSRATNLRLHKMVHTGERPVECELCDYRCRYRANMVKHMLVHSGVANYECEVCLKKFKRSEHLKKHKNTHG